LDRISKDLFIQSDLILLSWSFFIYAIFSSGVAFLLMLDEMVVISLSHFFEMKKVSHSILYCLR
jgi:hypothetical protein